MIGSGSTFERAVNTTRRAVAEFVLTGADTNRTSLLHILGNSEFISGDARTNFLLKHPVNHASTPVPTQFQAMQELLHSVAPAADEAQSDRLGLEALAEDDVVVCPQVSDQTLVPELLRYVMLQGIWGCGRNSSETR